MPSPSKAETRSEEAKLARLPRQLGLAAQVEQSLRRAIAEGSFADGRVPTEAELARQFGVSRETVRQATEALERDGLVTKQRRSGTLLKTPVDASSVATAQAIAYIQPRFDAASGHEDAVTRMLGALMLQGALEEASKNGYALAAQHVRQPQMGRAFQEIQQSIGCRGAVFAHYGEEKHLRRAVGLGIPIVLLDHDLYLPMVHSVRDDSFQGAVEAVGHLVELGHRKIAYFNWWQAELNPWRLKGYRQALRDAGLPRRRCWELSVELTPAGVRKAIDEFLALAPRPTALYCFCNSLAQLVLDELARRKVPVPEQVSVVGGGGEEIPGLACNQTDWTEMGRIAVRVLFRAMGAAKDRPPEHILCPHVIQAGRTAARLATG